MKRKFKFLSEHSIVIICVILLVFVSVILLMVKLGKFEKNIEERIEEKRYPIEYMEYVMEASDEFDVPAEIIYGVIFVESSFRPAVVSTSGAVGLMQLKPDTFLDMQSRYLQKNPDMPTYTDEMLTDPQINIFYGSCYLKYLYDYFGDWELAYAAYNGGMGNVRKWLADERYSSDGKLTDIPFEETDRYVRKVIAAVEKYKAILIKED